MDASMHVQQSLLVYEERGQEDISLDCDSFNKAVNKIALSSIATLALLYAFSYTAASVSLLLLLNIAAIVLSGHLLISSVTEFFESQRVEERLQEEIASYDFNTLNGLVEALDSTRFRAIFGRLKETGRNQEAANLVARLLEERVSHLELEHPDRQTYEFILTNIKIVYPELRDYFQQRYIGDGLYSTALTPAALRLIFSQLSQKGSLRDLRISVCDDYRHFEKDLSAVFVLAGKPGFSRHALAFRHRTSNYQDLEPHLSPIYVVKEDNVLKVVSLDGGLKSPWTAKIVKSIKAAYDKSQSRLPMQIYTYVGEGRHKDRTNCPVFIVRDLVHMAQEPRLCMQWIERHSQFKGNGLFVFSFAVPRMMKLTQSLTQIRKYIAALKYDPVIKRETLSQSVRRTTKRLYEIKQNKVKDQNVKTARVYLKYERMIIRTAIANRG